MSSNKLPAPRTPFASSRVTIPTASLPIPRIQAEPYPAPDFLAPSTSESTGAVGRVAASLWGSPLARNTGSTLIPAASSSRLSVAKAPQGVSVVGEAPYSRLSVTKVPPGVGVPEQALSGSDRNTGSTLIPAASSSRLSGTKVPPGVKAVSQTSSSRNVTKVPPGVVFAGAGGASFSTSRVGSSSSSKMRVLLSSCGPLGPRRQQPTEAPDGGDPSSGSIPSTVERPDNAALLRTQRGLVPAASCKQRQTNHHR